jgi:hypothetical protein
MGSKLFMLRLRKAPDQPLAGRPLVHQFNETFRPLNGRHCDAVSTKTGYRQCD